MTTKINRGMLICAGLLVAHFSSSTWAKCTDITRTQLRTASDFVKDNEQALTAGLGNHMWVVFLNETGKVCQVMNTAGGGQNSGQVWAVSRMIALQKANTSTGLSLDNAAAGGGIQAWASGALFLAASPVFDPATGLVASTASALQGSLFGLQFSNPVNAKAAYAGDPSNYGTSSDPANNKRLGGINVFGGGLPIYDSNLVKIGAIGVSGDLSCTDHAFSWRVREKLAADLGLATGAVIEAASPISQLLDISGNAYPGCGAATPPSNGANPANGNGIINEIL